MIVAVFSAVGVHDAERSICRVGVLRGVLCFAEKERGEGGSGNELATGLFFLWWGLWSLERFLTVAGAGFVFGLDFARRLLLTP